MFGKPKKIPPATLLGQQTIYKFGQLIDNIFVAK